MDKRFKLEEYINLTKWCEVNELLKLDCPLDLHCRYSWAQILVAMDFVKTSTVREGVKYLPDKKGDIFFVTLNKSDKEYSPSTRYNDYSANEKLFYWQSQNTTGVTSPMGQWQFITRSKVPWYYFSPKKIRRIRHIIHFCPWLIIFSVKAQSL